MVETLEDIFVGRNCAARVPYTQHNITGSASAGCTDPDQPARPVVLSCVLEEILHNKGGIPFFSGNKYTGGKFLLNFHIRRIGKRAKIIEPLIDELAKIHRCGRNL